MHLNPPALVAVYCGSRMGNQPSYAANAKQLGENLAEAGLGLVYGGASIGLMGVVADAVLARAGVVVGVIPEFMLAYEVAHDHLTELHVVDSMHTRKAMMAARASAFVALPGGFGTLEELTESVTWAQLGQHRKPMILLNDQGYFDGLLLQVQRAVTDGFLNPRDAQRLIVCDTVRQVMSHLEGLSAQPVAAPIVDF
jgi:hypothetical protein